MEKVKTLYKLKDWSSLGQVKNNDNPDIVARYVFDPASKVHSIMVVNKRTSDLLVKVNVDSGNVWSLTDEEALAMLNSYGFNCELDTDPVKISDSLGVVLHGLHDLGYKYITRVVKPKGQVIVYSNYNNGIYEYTDQPPILSDINYDDWKFLSINVVTSIDKILKLGE